jgi:hypothetical protein
MICEPGLGESCNTCATDCGNCAGCGDGVCAPLAGESCNSCPGDCGPCNAQCGDGQCNPLVGEACNTCPEDCGSCVFCGDGACNNGEDQFNCAIDCACSSGACGGVAPGGCWCDAACVGIGDCCWDACDACGQCGNQDFCGDGVCTGFEDCSFCPEDCGSCDFCGDGLCGDFEDCDVCPQDCGDCGFDGCAADPGPGCDGCGCEACVCGILPSCCDNSWAGVCALACQFCGGCG